MQLWLEGSRGLVQVVIVVKLREGSLPVAPEVDNSSYNSDSSDDDKSVVSIDDQLAREDDLLVGPIKVSIELWRWRNGVVCLDYELVNHLVYKFSLCDILIFT